LIKGTLEWRRACKPQLITAEDVKIELVNEGKMYKNGLDKTGRPIIYMKPGKDNTGAPEKEVKVKYLVYLMEKAIRSMDESKGVEKLVLIIDYKGYSQLAGLTMTRISKEILDILQDHYPERLGIAFIINAPWAWTVLWKMLQPFLTDRTKKKVRMLSSGDYSEIHEIVDLEVLETSYGGKNDFQYKWEKILEKKRTNFIQYLLKI